MASRRAVVVRQALRSSRLRRLLAAFLIFNIAEWANWIAILVWAYGLGGVRWASAAALIQLLPAAVLASPAAALSSRVTRPVALTLGYGAQGVLYVALGTLLACDAPLVVIGLIAAVASVAVTLTRPVHNAILPEISDTTEELTVGNSASGAAEAAAILVGPLASGLLISLLGPGGVVLVMGALSLVACLATASLRRVDARPVPVSRSGTRADSPARKVLRDPAARTLVGLVAAENALVGMMDILFVVLALDLLGMGASGPGVLNSAIGLGGLAGATVTFLLVGRQRLAPMLVLGGVVAGLAFGLAGFVSAPAAAVLLVAVSGAGKLFFDVTTRTFLQRSLPDRLLTAVFGLNEAVMMAGLAIGTVLTPLLVEQLGPRQAFVGAGLLLPLTSLLAWPYLRRHDTGSQAPVDVLDLLRRVPLLGVLPPRVVERLAREAIEVTASAGTTLVTEGEPGDRFFVIRSGRVEVSHGDRVIRQLGEGDWFGELALLRDIPRTATVTGLSATTLCVLERDSFLAAVAPTRVSLEVADAHAREHYL